MRRILHAMSAASLFAALLLAGCVSRPAVVAPEPAPAPTAAEITAKERAPVSAADLDSVLDDEARLSFAFFWEQANTTEGSSGYGLIRDRWPGNPRIASIASVGFGLAALPIGVERGWVDREQARARALGTLRTFQHLPTTHGFFFHFLTMNDGYRDGQTEVSIIDTGLFIAGALAAGSYFGGEVEQAARALYEAIDWPWYVDPAKQQFWMGYKPETGFEGHWDFYAEQLMLYVMAAGSPTHPVGREVYDGFTRHTASYRAGDPFIHSWFGSLFTYQYSHAFVDFRGRKDAKGVDWFENSVRASKAQYQYAQDNPNARTALGTDAWGLSASDAPGGYDGLAGAPPSGFDNRQHRDNGTVPPSAALGSIVFTPDQSTAAARWYRGFPKLWGRYGFQDAYNLDTTPPWFDGDVIGIDKGVTLLMLENHRSGLVWKLFMAVPAIQHGMDALGFEPAADASSGATEGS